MTPTSPSLSTHTPAIARNALRTAVPVFALALLLALNCIFTPNFARLEMRDGRVFGSLVDIAQNGSPVVLLAIGMTLIIATGGIDLSVGSVMALAGTAAALLLVRHQAPVPLAIAAALLIAALAGFWNGALVTYVGLQPIVATLILLVTGRGIAQALTGDQKIRFENPAFEVLANGSWLGLPLPVYLAVGTAIVVLLLLRRTVLGMYVEAVGGNPAAARLCGLRLHGLRLTVYTFGGLCAGLAGLIATADIKEADVASCGLYLELDAILAVVIGGTRLAGGRPCLVGAVVGALFMQTLTTMLQMHGVVTEHTLIVKAVIALAVCTLQSPVASRLWTGRGCDAVGSAPSPAYAGAVPRTRRTVMAGAAVFLLLYAAAAIRYADDNFLSPAVFLNLLADNSFLGVVAVGLTLVIISGGIDLSVGAVMSASSVVIAVLIMRHGWSPLSAMAAVAGLGLAFGAAMGATIHYLRLAPFIVTLAGMFLARGLGFLVNLESVAIDTPAQTWLATMGVPLAGGILRLPALVFLAVVLIGAYVLRHTAFGRTVLALGGNEEAAVLMGLPVARTRITVYALSGLSAALAGALLTIYLSSGSHIEGIGLELDAIAAVVVGGTLLTGGVGSILGSMLGVLIIGTIITVITTYAELLSSGLTKVAIGLLLLAFVVLQRLLTAGLPRRRA